MRRALRVVRVMLVLGALCIALSPAVAHAHDYFYWYAVPQQKVYPNTLRPLVYGRAQPSTPASLPSTIVPDPPASPPGSLSPTPSVPATSPPAKPTLPPPTIGPMTVSAARAEYEGRQLAIRSYESTLTDVWIEASRFVIPNAEGTPSVIPSSSVSVFKVHYVRIKTPSYGYSRRGLEPDPLIPMTLANGQRLGWRPGQPFDHGQRSVPWNATQPFYVLFRVPDDAAPGTYEGTLTVTASSEDTPSVPVVEIPVRLTVFPFSIAARTLRTSFGLSLRWAQYGNSANGRWLPPLTRVGPDSDRVPERTWSHMDQIGGWLRYMSEHRLSPQTLLPAWDTGSDWAPPADDGTMISRENLLADYLGTGPATTFAGERFGFNSVRMPEMETRPSYISNPFSSSAALSSAKTYFRTMWAELKPWLSKAYVYAIDEPTAYQRDFVERYGYLAHTSAPGVEFMVTVDPVNFGYRPFCNVDTYVHKLHFFYRDYSRWVAPLRRWGKSVWIYSHMGRQQTGTPMYLIDKPLTDSRVQGWFAYHTRADGLLYYSVNRWAGAVRGSTVYRDPYADPLSLASTGPGTRIVGNGEGSLTYPGYYPALGLVVQGAPPVGSMRMEALRDGIEDYEYLQLVQKRYGSTAAMGYTKRIIGKPATVVTSGRPTFPSYQKTPSPYEAARVAMAEAIAR